MIAAGGIRFPTCRRLGLCLSSLPQHEWTTRATVIMWSALRKRITTHFADKYRYKKDYYGNQAYLADFGPCSTSELTEDELEQSTATYMSQLLGARQQQQQFDIGTMKDETNDAILCGVEDNTRLDEWEEGPSLVKNESVGHQPSFRTESFYTDGSGFEMISTFHFNNSPSPHRREDLQLWLECEAQQEAVRRYQHILDEARNRRDYASLPIVQQQVLQWFRTLSDAIAVSQKSYIFKDDDQDANSILDSSSSSSSTNTDEGESRDKKPGEYKYGPYLCVLPSVKISVIVAHEAIIQSLRRPGEQGRYGVPFVSLATRLGEAIEEETIIHRLLHKRHQEAQQRRRQSLGTVAIHVTDLADPDSSIGSVADEYDDIDPEDSGVDINDTLKKSSQSSQHWDRWSYSATNLQNYLDEMRRYKPTAKKRRVIAYAISKAREVLDNEEPWSPADKAHLGAVLIQILLENTTIIVDGVEQPAFSYEKRWTGKNHMQGFIAMNQWLVKKITSDEIKSFAASTTRYKPMIVPTKPWKHPDDGGYMWLRPDLMRYHGCKIQKDKLTQADLSIVYDGLNAMGRVPWKINQQVLSVAQQCWEMNISIGDIPTQTDYEVPSPPTAPEYQSIVYPKDSPEYHCFMEKGKQYRESLARHRRIKQKNMVCTTAGSIYPSVLCGFSQQEYITFVKDLVSLRCSALLTLGQAEKFKGFDQIYFPYNIDFRGRAYPIPPHLSNVGSDLCRGLLQFAQSKPLGPRGLFWLKVHLANLAGNDKITYEERAKFTDDNMDKIRQSVEDPFGKDRWWMSLDDPFQGWATCREIASAIDSGDPESYMCSQPVHMDGSCNGLQHYAALLRDPIGGKAVNLCEADKPQDVYSGVMHEVIRRVALDAANDPPKFDLSNGGGIDTYSKTERRTLNEHRSAKLVNGLIDRGVVKRTVMTSVYGVTYVGARQQIQEKIESKLKAKGYDIDEMRMEIFHACGYLARITMAVIGDLFVGANEAMHWLTDCARLISQQGHPVAWITPIGLPVIQPYRREKSSCLVTLLQTISLHEDGDHLPIHRQRQVSAFPPNYIHSLDSSHMLLTALEMERRQLTFSAVHDSFWTHPSDVDEMNVALRQVFVELYSQPLLQQLHDNWKIRYPAMEFRPVPQQGKLDLKQVLSAQYFFQ